MDWNSLAVSVKMELLNREPPQSNCTRDIEQSIFDYQRSSDGAAARQARDPQVALDGGLVRRPPQARIILLMSEACSLDQPNYSPQPMLYGKGDKPKTHG